MLPYTTFQSENPEDLWKWMTEWEKTTGGKILAIPHNGNLSNGRMFALTTFSGDPLTKAWADARQRWEPLFEAIQMKGQSESHPSLSPTDDFAAYELWDRGNLTQTPKKPGMIAGEYAREALKNGLKVEQDLGTNPFKFGMAGGTDTHNGLVAAEEDNFFAKFPSAEPRPDRWDEDAMNFGPNRIVKGWEMTAAGYTAVWATGNTRAELWDAMMRRETYATSGPRMTVRFFGGYDFTAGRRDAHAGGGRLRQGRADGRRSRRGAGRQGADVPGRRAQGQFGGNLDRIQIIKGWLGKDGKPQEKIYDVVWGDKDRRKIVNGKLTPVGNTVDVATATWTNTIGDPELVTVWKDPDFDPSVRAVYYARVLEIPTPRWTAYDAAYFKIKITDPKVPMTTQERAFTSPIWYSPK